MLAPLFDRVPEIDAAEPIHLFDFPKSAMRSVIFGHKAADELKIGISNILSSDPEYAHVRLFTTVVDLEAGRLRMKSLIKIP